MEQNHEPLIKIGRFSQLCQMTKKTLRYYEKKELLVPAKKDELSGYRYYAVSQIEKGLILKQLSWADFSLKEMEKYLTFLKEKNQESAMGLLENKMKDIDEKYNHIRKVRDFLGDIMNKNHKELHIDQPEVKKVKMIRVLSMRTKGTYAKTIGTLIYTMLNYVKRHPNNELIRISGPSIFIAHDEEYKEQDADIEVCIPITGKVKPSNDIKIKYLPEIHVISVLHKGPYQKVGFAYEKILKYLNNQNLIAAGPSRELYLKTPEQIDSEDELLTEIQLPIENPD